MLVLITTTDAVKVTAVQALLAGAGIDCEVFDAAAGSLWRAIIPIRIMVADVDAGRARLTLTGAGFVAAGDGDWDLADD